MHGVRRELLEAQARAADLPLWPVEIPRGCINEDYDRAMGSAVACARAEGVECIAFGDLFLREIREYREQRLAGSGVEPIFPLWDRPTSVLASDMIAGGLKARIACLDPQVMPRELAGHDFDRVLLEKLPPEVDPCGERGEFHTFAYDGPMFGQRIPIQTGETVEREGFVFTDLRAGTPDARARRVRTYRGADSSARASSASPRTTPDNARNGWRSYRD